MTHLDKMEQEEFVENYQQLIQNQQTLILATVSSQGEPESSYAPYVKGDDNVFYIFVSELATHTKHMMESARVSVLFIQPEQGTKNFFARERVVFNCAVTEVRQDDALYNQLLDEMNNQFGETVGLLRSLSDFHLLALTPSKGKYVAGFGKAFSINMADGSLD